ncbi:MAG: cellulase family glycosylhydrolase [Anaerolineae bacterium]|nr:cellulase family glycosylhydrolase [Anaerolineae bacterium]
MSSSNPNPLMHIFETVVESRLGGVVINFLLIPLLILSALLLPPVSLADRVLSIGYERIGRDGGAIQDPDGTQITFLPEGIRRSFRVRLNAIPRSLFLQGTANNPLSPAETGNLLNAAESIPPNLIVKSPFYRLQHKGVMPERVMLNVPIPNEAEPYNTLDLYAWNGESWEWLPNRKILTEDRIESELDYLPDSVVVMQTHPIHPNVSTDYSLNTTLPDDVKDALVEINPQGLLLDSNGGLVDNLGQLPPEIQNATTFTVIPTIRNWSDDGSIRSDLIDNLLIDAEARELHIEEIVSMVQRNGYEGIDLDYRGINPDLRQEYASFLAQLRNALPGGTQLSVRVELPHQISADTWDTGGYDWQAIGRVANVVKVPTYPDPRAYAPGGQMETMLDWAVGQINRYKLQLLLPTSSTEQVNGITRNISYQQALEPIGAASIVGESNIVAPGEEVAFTLRGAQASTGIQFDGASGTYWFAYLDDNNVQHTVYLENAASIARKLQLVAQYNLRGVAVQNLLNENNDARIWEVVRKFLDLVIPPVESEYSVIWRVQNETGGVIAEEIVDLSEPNYRWQAPEAGGSYTVNAAISSGKDSNVAVPRGEVALLVATPTPSPTPTPLSTPTPTPEPPTPTPQPQSQEEAPAQEAPAQQPAAAPPPAAASVNVPFGYGVQADPRGNTAGNIGHIKALGFNWVKFQMPWKDVESSPGNYSWGMWDDIIGQYNANGINVMLSIPKAPSWARPGDDDKSVEGPPADPATYANFVAQVATRYAGKVQAIEVWNEQNLWYEAGGRGRINPAAYVQLLQLSYQAIKAVNPDMIVISGALTPAGSVGDMAMDDIDYLNQMYANGAKGYFDALGAHPSGYNCPANGDWTTVEDPTATNFRGPFENRHHSWCFRGTMEGYRNVMVANGDGGKAISPTEFGWAVSGNPQPGYEYARDNTYEEQAQWFVEAYQLAKGWGWVGPMFLWNLDYGVTAPGTELAAFGIIGTPTFNALATMPK